MFKTNQQQQTLWIHPFIYSFPSPGQYPGYFAGYFLYPDQYFLVVDFDGY